MNAWCNGFAQPFRHRPRLDTGLRAWVLVSHGLALGLLWAGIWPAPVEWAGSLVLVAALAHALLRGLPGSRWHPVEAVRWTPEGGWALRLDGRWRTARPLPDSRLWQRWASVGFRVDGRRRPLYLLFRRADLGGCEYRRLVVRLRFGVWQGETDRGHRDRAQVPGRGRGLAGGGG